MRATSCLLIADSGSTKTDWLVKPFDGKAIKFQSAGLNPFYQTEEEVVSVLANEVVPHLSASIDHIFFYGAGCADERSGLPVKNALINCFPTASIVKVASDMLGAARGLCGRETGLACILGTGANNAFYDGEQVVRSVGSLGFWLGDEGSGSYLGKTLVVDFIQNELPEDLQNKFALAYPQMSRLALLENAYRKPFPNRYFATFSKFIFDHIDHPFLHDLVAGAFDLFIEKYVSKHPESTKYPVHFTGSIAYFYQDILKKSLERKGLASGRILKTPLEGLLAYHL